MTNADSLRDCFGGFCVNFPDACHLPVLVISNAPGLLHHSFCRTKLHPTFQMQRMFPELPFVLILTAVPLSQRLYRACLRCTSAPRLARGRLERSRRQASMDHGPDLVCTENDGRQGCSKIH